MANIIAKVLSCAPHKTKEGEPRFNSHLQLTQDLGIDKKQMKVWYWGKTELTPDATFELNPNNIELFEGENENGKFVAMKLKMA